MRPAAIDTSALAKCFGLSASSCCGGPAGSGYSTFGTLLRVVQEGPRVVASGPTAAFLCVCP